jgi:hypothetical protein
MIRKSGSWFSGKIMPEQQDGKRAYPRGWTRKNAPVTVP